MENLDLDINNYTIKDIEKFFRFRPNSHYTAKDVEQKEYEIREQLLTSGHVNRRFKSDLIAFLEKAKEWLTLVKCKPDNAPTIIPKNYKLDTLDTPLSKEPLSRSDDLIQRPNTQFIYTQESDFLPGVINPLTTRVITKCLNIDTKFRDNLYTTQCSDFTIQLPMKLNKVVSMQLSALEIPITFYGISTDYGNNFWYMSVNYTPPNTTTPVNESKICVVPDGNYNAFDFIEVLNKVIKKSTSPAFSIYSYLEFTLDITSSGSGTGKLTIDASGAYQSNVNTITLDFRRDIIGNIDSIPVTSKIGWNLGFTRALYTGQPKYVADTIIEPASLKYFYLVVDDFNNSANNHFIGIFNKSVLSPNILARISMKGSYFSILMESDFTVVTEPRKYFGPVDIQKLKIQLIDDHGRVLKMNDSNFSFSIVLKMVYDL